MAMSTPQVLILGDATNPTPIAFQFEAWEVEVCAEVRTLFIGALHFDEIIYHTTPEGIAHVRLEYNPRPILVGNNQAAWEAQTEAWESKNKELVAFKKGDAKAKTIYIAKLFSTLKAQLTAHLGGPTAFLAAESHTIFHAGRELWKQATTSDLHMERRLMDGVFTWENPMSLPIHLAKIEERAGNLKKNHNELPQNELIQIIQTTIELSAVASAFAAAMAYFHLTNSIPGSVGRSVKGFGASLLIANSLILSPPRCDIRSAYHVDASLAPTAPSVTATAAAAL